mmetsp:Transcript_5357/g.10251  ORF Transcript_5357/g.10251 Transcript_5357/m.10251 type:complete len:240 (+) Transcript_5357:30-749(+)
MRSYSRNSNYNSPRCSSRCCANRESFFLGCCCCSCLGRAISTPPLVSACRSVTTPANKSFAIGAARSCACDAVSNLVADLGFCAALIEFCPIRGISFTSFSPKATVFSLSGSSVLASIGSAFSGDVFSSFDSALRNPLFQPPFLLLFFDFLACFEPVPFSLFDKKPFPHAFPCRRCLEPLPSFLFLSASSSSLASSSSRADNELYFSSDTGFSACCRCCDSKASTSSSSIPCTVSSSFA